MENKAAFYKRLTQQALALIEGEKDLIANISNISALLNMELEDINWVGFYLLKDDQLVLGPFQGKPACVRIPVGRGVCGTAVSEKKVQRVTDVHAFPGHIACDAVSNSEIVLPLIVSGEVIGVLDIDSPSLSRFDQNDELGLIYFIEELQKYL
ncbi:GAF domain-containing protein [Photobacterium damselae subsp. piscicida]|uniref:GAF domain-containing protein n=1 Tax=Photobacterium damsela subsp. piscicida TaxID=38294 RepID=A0A7L8A714_PHODP|nr:GAF domain-containing protein [Photobacterium damselae]MDP2514257.1 GAF domain-containing protein [Photobacterium damselae subsp. piscicida]MDP2532794.1 GAF domain-containing protein [Photobacterium damselae subsp. piscicida]MDP2545800.1 GAF domain-containing protein [Photobacterium damselae subsp. piscicida]MDP2558848.1 GAF domain-containing protein [Photobacterium damselae subsp. piscicida]MDP2569633.1 GAF domain-containing protein [Photobacterium damselae subsp. piscicida]